MKLTLLALIALLAIGAFDGGVSGLLTLAPFVMLMGLLLAGFYPGEGIIEAVVEAITCRPRSRREPGGGLPRGDFRASSILLTAVPGSRAPPGTCQI